MPVQDFDAYPAFFDVRGAPISQPPTIIIEPSHQLPSGSATPYYSPGGSGKTPDQITGLVRWYKADAITGVADGAAIPQWNSVVGGAGAYMSASSPPTYKVSVLNNLPVCRFDGVANYLDGNTPVNVVQPFTLFFVMKLSVLPATGQTMQVYMSMSDQASQIGYADNGTSYLYSSPGPGLNEAVSSFGAFHAFAYVFNGASSRIHTDALLSTGDGGTGDLQNVRIATSASGASHFNGDIAEICLYTNAVANTDVQALIQGFRYKYGTP
jgi:hypothetical protein